MLKKINKFAWVKIKAKWLNIWWTKWMNERDSDEYEQY